MTVGKAEYRRLLCKSQSAKCIGAYLYAAAGYGESTTDLSWDGHGIICENGEVLAESPRFEVSDRLIQADVDLEHLRQERTRTTSFSDCVQLHREQVARLRRVDCDLELPAGPIALERDVARFPYVPGDAPTLDERCREVYQIQVQGLARRLDATGIIGPSVMQMLRDIDHPYARGEQVYDVTFENVQAGERTSHLFRLANLHGGLVVGTSDLSELALGYTTYGVGDHMSHYAVNASVPKTLVRHLILWVAASGDLGTPTAQSRLTRADVATVCVQPRSMLRTRSNRARPSGLLRSDTEVIDP